MGKQGKRRLHQSNAGTHAWVKDYQVAHSHSLMLSKYVRAHRGACQGQHAQQSQSNHNRLHCAGVLVCWRCITVVSAQGRDRNGKKQGPVPLRGPRRYSCGYFRNVTHHYLQQARDSVIESIDTQTVTFMAATAYCSPSAYYYTSCKRRCQCAVNHKQGAVNQEGPSLQGAMRLGEQGSCGITCSHGKAANKR